MSFIKATKLTAIGLVLTTFFAWLCLTVGIEIDPGSAILWMTAFVVGAALGQYSKNKGE